MGSTCSTRILRKEVVFLIQVKLKLVLILWSVFLVYSIFYLCKLFKL